MKALNDHKKLMHAAAYASVPVTTFLIAVKTVAFMITGSITILSSLVDSFLAVLPQ